jgi:hypothetical protein
MNFHLDRPGQLPGEVFNMDPRAAVNVGWILASHQAYTHLSLREIELAVRLDAIVALPLLFRRKDEDKRQPAGAVAYLSAEQDV